LRWGGKGDAAARQFPSQSVQSGLHQGQDQISLDRLVLVRPQVPQVGIESSVTGGPHETDQSPRLRLHPQVPDALRKNPLPERQAARALSSLLQQGVEGVERGLPLRQEPVAGVQTGGRVMVAEGEQQGAQGDLLAIAW